MGLREKVRITVKLKKSAGARDGGSHLESQHLAGGIRQEDY